MLTNHFSMTCCIQAWLSDQRRVIDCRAKPLHDKINITATRTLCACELASDDARKALMETTIPVYYFVDASA